MSGLICCHVPLPLKAELCLCLAALGGAGATAGRVWAALEAAQLVSAAKDKRALNAELQEVGIFFFITCITFVYWILWVYFDILVFDVFIGGMIFYNVSGRQKSKVSLVTMLAFIRNWELVIKIKPRKYTKTIVTINILFM